MVRHLLLVICLIFSRLVLAASLEGARFETDQMVISLRADPSCPMSCDPSSPFPGYVIEMARAIYEPQGFQIDYQSTSWERLSRDFESGQIDIAVGVASSELSESLKTPAPIGWFSPAFAKLRGSAWHWTNDPSAALQGQEIGAVPGRHVPFLLRTIFDPASRTGAVFPLRMADSLSSGLRMLQQHRITLLLGDQRALDWGIRMAGGGPTLEIVPLSEPPIPLFLAFTLAPLRQERSHILLGLWTDGLAHLRTTGELSRILARYGLQESQVMP